jgi:glycine cleavage system aminomethyltransferase T
MNIIKSGALFLAYISSNKKVARAKASIYRGNDENRERLGFVLRGEYCFSVGRGLSLAFISYTSLLNM